MTEKGKQEQRNVDGRAEVRRPAETPSLTERVSYAWGRWLAVPADPRDEFVLA